MKPDFKSRLNILTEEHRKLILRKNERIESGNGIFHRYRYPVLTGGHTPLFWRYDLNPETNPHLMERFGIHAVFNAGALKKEKINDSFLS
jgi:4-O-beta-D-mannosyl-D-glucose phosphorylase